MITKEFKITNRLGLHARPAAQLVQAAGNFDCDVKIIKDGVEVDAKSIMGVMMLAAECGAVLQMQFNGADEEKAAAAITALFENKFNEDL